MRPLYIYIYIYYISFRVRRTALRSKCFQDECPSVRTNDPSYRWANGPGRMAQGECPMDECPKDNILSFGRMVRLTSGRTAQGERPVDECPKDKRPVMRTNGPSYRWANGPGRMAHMLHRGHNGPTSLTRIQIAHCPSLQLPRLCPISNRQRQNKGPPKDEPWRRQGGDSSN